jgi:hypothetical protein
LANPQGGEPYPPVAFTGSAATFGPYDAVALLRIEVATGSTDYALVPFSGSDEERAAIQSAARLTLQTGRQAGVNVQRGQVLTVAAASGASGSIVPLPTSNGGEPGSPVAYTGSALTFGPFTSLRRYLASCSVGPMALSVGYVAGGAPIVVPGTNVPDFAAAGFPLPTFGFVPHVSGVTESGGKVTAIPDLFGTYGLESVGGNGPIVRTDEMGRKAIRHAAGAFLRNANLTGQDTYNYVVLAVSRNFFNQTATLFSVGNNGASPAGGSLGQLAWAGGTNTRPSGAVLRPLANATTSPGTTNFNKMFVGSAPAVVGSAIATADGIGGAATTATARSYLNADACSGSAASARFTARVGFEVGRLAANAGNPLYGDWYALFGWSTGQFNSGNYAAQVDALAAFLMNWFGIAERQKRISLIGDSRSEMQISSGNTLSMIMTEPGSANSLPTGYDVVPLGNSGKGWHQAYTATQMPSGVVQNGLGEGKDLAIVMMDTNDVAATSGWPALNTQANTAQRAQEVYNGGASLDASFTGSISGATLTVSGVTGVIRDGMRLMYAGAPSNGVYINSGAGTTWTLNTSPGNVTGLSMTAGHGDCVRTVNALLANNHKVLVAFSPVTDGDNSAAFRSIQIANIVADTQSGSGQINIGKVRTVDSREIAVGGQKVFGVNAQFPPAVPTAFQDGTHPSDIARHYLNDGGDTSQFGYRQNIIELASGAAL